MTERQDFSKGASEPGAGLRAYSKLVVFLTFVLILAGGNVTSKDAGLVIPDWPLSFNTLNPEGWHTVPLVRDEHFHRLAGATVGLIVIVLLAWTWGTRQRRTLRNLTLAILLAVIVQGLMGGLRVIELSIAWAIIHGCFAQAFFCMTVAMAVLTSKKYPKPVDELKHDQAKAIRGWTLALTLIVFAQLILGAILRHTGGGVVVHILGALVVGVCLMQMANHTMSFADGTERGLVRSTITLFLMYGLQLVLGVMTFLVTRSASGDGSMTPMQAYLPTMHVALGALILATSFALTLRAYGLTRGGERGAEDRLPAEALA